MKTFKLNPALKMLKSELAQFEALPDNMPGTPLSTKQKEFVSAMYYKYIKRNIDNQGYEIALYEQEMTEKWPSGPRVKEHEAKRFILGQLIELNGPNRIKMSSESAAKYFLASLHWRSTNQKVIRNAYSL